MILSPGSRADRLPLRTRYTPALSVVAGSLASAAPLVADAPVLPPLGFLVLLSWRLLRPEPWPAWVALPLGLIDDLASGQPIGSGMASWTLMLLGIDWLDRRFGARDVWFDWSIAGIATILVLTGGMLASALPLSMVPTILPQIAISILCFPAVERAVAAIDRWRLRR